MKISLIISAFLVMFLVSFPKDKEIRWLKNFDQAKKDGKSQKKQILIFYSGSDWCINCIKLKKTVLKSDLFIKYAKSKFIMVNADFPIKKKNQLSKKQIEINESLSENYNPKGIFPTLAIVSNNGKKIGSFSGYKNESAKEVILYLKKLMKLKK